MTLVVKLFFSSYSLFSSGKGRRSLVVNLGFEEVTAARQTDEA
jgi:hypothetical protein